nr:histidine kinase dimerization/phospho-acceptor domain-containing protein [Deinococcus sp. KNUC1210]
MRLYPRLVLAFVLVALFAIGTTSILDIQAAYGRIQGMPPPAGIPGTARPPNRPRPDDVHRLIQGLRVSQIGAGVLAFSAALLIGSLLALRLVRPIRELTQVNRLYLQGDRNLRYTGQGRDELHELGLTFNMLADQLETEQRQQKQLVADVAHELRTPLTVLRGELEYLQDGLSEATPQIIGRLTEEVDLLVRLVGDLRLLSLADSGGLSFAPERLDLLGLLRGSAQAFGRLAQERGCRIEVEGTSEFVRADRDRMRQIIHNLLDNALRHTGPGSSIECRVRQVAGGTELSVRDHGPGLPERRSGTDFPAALPQRSGPHPASGQRQRAGSGDCPNPGGGAGRNGAGLQPSTGRGRVEGALASRRAGNLTEKHPVPQGPSSMSVNSTKRTPSSGRVDGSQNPASDHVSVEVGLHTAALRESSGAVGGRLPAKGMHKGEGAICFTCSQGSVHTLCLCFLLLLRRPTLRRFRYSQPTRPDSPRGMPSTP